MDRIYLSQAYRYVAVFMMLCQVNFYAHKLQLPVSEFITERDLTFMHVSPPRLIGQAGAVHTKLYSFGFSNNGRLRYITRLHPFGDEPLLESHLKQAKMTSLINKDQALEIARHWLALMDVSVTDLEKTNKPAVEQLFFYPDATPTGSIENLKKVLLPIFNVSWGSGDDSAVTVSIYGPTKELLDLRLEDDSFSRRPIGLVQDAEKLLGMPDADFSRFSKAELNDLLLQQTKNYSEVSQFLYSTNGAYTNILMQQPVQPDSTNAPQTSPNSR